VVIQGTISNYQQYADLMLALLRNPMITAVSRTGYVSDEQFVPALVPTDQRGKPRRPGETPIPDDPLERLAYFQSQTQPSGYEGVGNFGSGNDSVRTAKPGDSLISVTMTVKANMQVPNPRATLTAGGGGAGGATLPAGGPPTAGGPAGGPPASVGAGAPGAKQGAAER